MGLSAILDFTRFGQMPRSNQLEILETEPVTASEMGRSYRQLHALQGFLGNSKAVLRLLKEQQNEGIAPLRRVLDIGCGQGGLLKDIQRELGVEGIGIDLQAAPPQSSIPILTGDAVRDCLPRADAGICMMMAHHLPPDDIVALIQNISLSCDRFLLLDLVRHRVPLALFQIFVQPFLCRINRLDGQTSIRRAYTEAEMHGIVTRALSDGRPVLRWKHTVSAFWTRQIVDIEWCGHAVAEGDLTGQAEEKPPRSR